MAIRLVSGGSSRDNKNDDESIPWRQLVQGIDDRLDFLDGLSSRLGFIIDGLRSDKVPLGIDGAWGLLSDIEERIQDEHYSLKNLLEVATVLARKAGATGPGIDDCEQG